MSRIFKGQTSLRIKLKTFTALTGAVNTVIKYIKPDGTAGFFPAAVSDVLGGIIFHECIDGDLDQAGWWSFWAFIEFDDGRTAAGEVSKVFVWEEGKGAK
ncbi:MAG: hypothetical protein LBV68_06480 [Spirochaetaceae bacterium]|jgi:hypothetical protein|nr:hypothetical protein [Spirochaetaceae bacterium]